MIYIDKFNDLEFKEFEKDKMTTIIVYVNDINILLEELLE